MFIPATFIKDAVQVCTNEWTDKKNIVCTTVEYWSAWKWKKILTYATAWVNLKDIKWIGQTENPNTMWLHLLIYMKYIELSESYSQKVEEERLLPGAGGLEEYGAIV